MILVFICQLPKYIDCALVYKRSQNHLNLQMLLASHYFLLFFISVCNQVGRRDWKYNEAPVRTLGLLLNS